MRIDTYSRIPNDQATDLRARLARVRRGCAHLATTPIVLGCFQHLDMFRCIDCATAHTATHSHELEHSCDVCSGSLHGDDGDTWHVGLLAPVEVDRTVSLGRGRTVHVGTVTLIGWGECWSCHVDGELGGVR